MQKTDTAKSPLLKPVIERDYTKGINIQEGLQMDQGSQQASPEPKAPEPKPGPQAQQARPAAEPKFNIPPDDTKEFSFTDMPDSPSDIGEDDHSSGVSISSASAKSFANFAGDALQMYLPKLTYGYCKIDMENVVVNVEAGKLTVNWVDVFQNINKHTEEALKISDDAIKMWKKAFKDYLESENMAFANPKTAFILATVVLLADQGVKAYQIRKANEEYMRQALEASNPGVFAKKEKQPQEKTPKTDFTDGADKKAA